VQRKPEPTQGLCVRSCFQLDAFRVKPGKVISDEGGGKTESDWSTGGFGHEKAFLDQSAEETARGAFGFLQDPGGLATGDFAAQENIADQMRDGVGSAGAVDPAFRDPDDAFLKRVEVEQGGHEVDLIDGGPEKKAAELGEPSIREVAAPIEIVATGCIATRKRSHVFVAPAGETA